jgi:hypothetical protein
MFDKTVYFAMTRETKNLTIRNLKNKLRVCANGGAMMCNELISRPADFTSTPSLFKNGFAPLCISRRSANVASMLANFFSPLIIAMGRAKAVFLRLVVWIKFFVTLFANMKGSYSVRSFYWGSFAKFALGQFSHIAKTTLFGTLIFLFTTFTFVFHNALSNNPVNSGKPKVIYYGNPEPILSSNRLEGAQTKIDPTDNIITNIVIDVKGNNIYQRRGRKVRDSRSPAERQDNLENYICIASVNALRGIKNHSDWTDAAKYGNQTGLPLFVGEYRQAA